MKLPNSDKAKVEESKIRDYLLNTEHKDGANKAIFFIQQGYSIKHLDIFIKDLVNHAQRCNLIKTEETYFGMKYIIEGVIMSPKGNKIGIRTVWIVENDKKTPILITAYAI